jgi:hypothetical protein
MGDCSGDLTRMSYAGPTIFPVPNSPMEVWGPGGAARQRPSYPRPVTFNARFNGLDDYDGWAVGGGQVDINGGAFNPTAPFGSYKQSGNGREAGKYGLQEFFEVKSLKL